MTITNSKPSKYITTSAHNRTGVRGYYLVLPNKDRHWMGETMHSSAKALDKMCDKYLSDAIGWDYWIDWCMGYDVQGKLAWANMDQSDSIEATSERMGW